MGLMKASMTSSPRIPFLRVALLATSDSLFFVAGGRLFKVAVANARGRDASFGAVTSTADVDATPVASPALVYLDLLGTPTAHVAIGTEDGDLRTYRAADLTPGPAATGLPLADEVLTPIVPAGAGDRTPGPGSPVESAPVVYVSATSNFFGPESAAVYKLEQDATDLALVTLAPFPGEPSPAMAVTQIARPGTAMEDGKLLLGTSINLFLASTRDLDVVGSFDTEFDLSGGTTGFQQTTGAVSGDHFYVANDQGEQFVARVIDGKPIVNTDQFDRHGANTPMPLAGVGQPAVARGYVAYGAPTGVFVYRNRDLTPPAAALTAPAAEAVVSGSVTVAAAASDARGVEQVEFRANGRSLGVDTSAGDDRGIASVRFMAGERAICTDTAAPYDCAYRLGAGDVGRNTLVAVATDTAGQTAAALRGVQVSRFASPGVSARTTPARDRRRPFRFTTSGRVRVPAGVSRSGACTGGRVSVQLKAARKTISSRRVALTRTCAYRSSVTFRSRKRLPRSSRLTVRVRFLGNAVLGPRSARSTAVRTR
jgi:Bacterial Ig domain